MSPRLSRRTFLLAGTAAAALAGCAKWESQAAEHGPIAAMFPGRIDDGGFVEAGYQGLLRIRDELRIPVRYVDGVAPDEEAMKAALRELARSDAKLVIAHGGQAAAAVQRVAWEFPQQRFVSIQGHLTRPNLSVYAVLQEQSAWLAGAAAGLLTKSNVVGHLSGVRDRAGLKARAAFAGGVRSTGPKARLLTHFSGSQDDAATAMRAAIAMIDAGADVLFTMLDAGRPGATEACRSRGVKQIGTVRDWVAAMPDAFVASAVANAGVAVLQAGRDLSDNMWKGELTRRFGVRTPEAVRLALAPTVSAAVQERVAAYTREMAAGSIAIPDDYAGPEFGVA